MLDEHAEEFQKSVMELSNSVGGYDEHTAEKAMNQILDARTNALIIKNVIRDASDYVMLDYVNRYSGKLGFPFFQSVRMNLLSNHEVWLELDPSFHAAVPAQPSNRALLLQALMKPKQ